MLGFLGVGIVISIEVGCTMEAMPFETPIWSAEGV